MNIIQDPSLYERYLLDASNLKGGTCKFLACPTNSEDLEKFLKTTKEQITISGNGTGTVGSRVPFGGVLVTMEKFNSIGEIHVTHPQWAEVDVGAGVVLKDFQEFCKAKGYHFLPNPTETNAFVGGNLATSASGSRSFLFGSCRDYVQELEVLTVEGEKLILKRGEMLIESQGKIGSINFTLPSYTVPNLKFASAYYIKHPLDAIDLFIGGEGTLGIILKAKLRIKKSPQFILAGVFYFETFSSLFECVKEFSKIRKETPSESPCSVEFFDEFCVDHLRTKFQNVPTSAFNALYLEQFVWTGQDQDEILETWITVLSKHGCLLNESIVALDEKSQKNLVSLRHSIPLYIYEHFNLNGRAKIGTDNALPLENFPKYYDFVCKISDLYKIPRMAFAHIGDGHLHINFLPKNEIDHEKTKDIFDEIMKKSIELGGNISAEHGLGRIKKKYLSYQYSEKEIKEMRDLKKAFDPGFRLNPGVLF